MAGPLRSVFVNPLVECLASKVIPSDVRVMVCQVDLLAARTVNDKIDPVCKSNGSSLWEGRSIKGRARTANEMRVRSFREALYDSGGKTYFPPWLKTPAH
jgi:hypothetical protein